MRWAGSRVSTGRAKTRPPNKKLPLKHSAPIQEGKIESGEEWLCVAKTRRELYDQVEAAIRELHPYDEPEIIATAIVAGSRGYLDWIDRETR